MRTPTCVAVRRDFTSGSKPRAAPCLPDRQYGFAAIAISANLGPLADADGHIDIQIRDLDQTVIGNPAHDLVRLGLSLASAARGADLSG